MQPKSRHSDWQVLSSNIEYQNRFTVICDHLRKPDGTTMAYRYLAGGHSSSVLAFTDENQVVLTRQYRHPLRRTIFDLPAGGIHEGETPLQAAIRELAEETGYTADTIQELGSICPSPGMTSRTSHIFVAHDLTPGPTNPDEHEIVEVVLMDWDTVVEMVLNGEAVDGSLNYAVLRWLATHKTLYQNLPPQREDSV